MADENKENVQEEKKESKYLIKRKKLKIKVEKKDKELPDKRKCVCCNMYFKMDQFYISESVLKVGFVR